MLVKPGSFGKMIEACEKTGGIKAWSSIILGLLLILVFANSCLCLFVLLSICLFVDLLPESLPRGLTFRFRSYGRRYRLLGSGTRNSKSRAESRIWPQP